MSTSKDFRDYVLEQLRLLENVTCRPMMGEYLLYEQGLLFGGIYDGRLLIKITSGNQKFQLREEIPYKGAKPMYMIDDLEDVERTREIILCTCQDLTKK